MSADRPPAAPPERIAVAGAQAPGPSPAKPATPASKPLRRRLLFLLFVLSPLAVLAVLMWLIAIAIERGPQMENERVGAGAGRTGGANAIGEMLKDK